MKTITIGSIEVPLEDYAVGASAILGIRDSGKTVTSKGIAEQLLDHNVPIIVFDAVGKWRWMKVAGEKSDGKAYKVVVAGGRNPDLPLTPHSVPEIVRSALKERIPLIIDLFDKNLSKADWRRIVQTAIHIIHYENEGGSVHVFLEEAAEYCPQKIYDGETYSEVEKLVRMGGNASVGITLINQRSQEINKAVLDNCSTALVLGCQVGKNAIEAVEKWIERLDPKTADELTQSLPKLKSGEAWVWTRKSLDRPTREKMPMCRSFHPDRRTPEIVLKTAKATDTDEFVARLANAIPKAIEEAKRNDPAELKKQIRELQKQVEAKPNKNPAAQPEKIPALTDHERTRLTKVIEVFENLTDRANAITEKANEIAGQLTAQREEVHFFKLLLEDKLKTAPPQRAAHARATPGFVARPTATVIRRPVPPPSNNGSMNHDSTVGGGMRRMMIALAQRPGINKRQLGVRAGLSSTSGTFGTYMATLRSRGYLNENGGGFNLTQEGLDALGQYDPLPEGQELYEFWMRTLGDSGAARILKVLSEAYPASLTKEEVGERAEISHTSGTFGTYLSKLRTLELIEGRGELKATSEFF